MEPDAKPSSAAGAATPPPSLLDRKRALLLRSKSLPAPELERRLPALLARHDSNQSGRSNSTNTNKDSGFVSTDNPSNEHSVGRQNGAAGKSGRGVGKGRSDIKSATIRQHYYPEGGWGWVVSTCAFFVHLVCHGLQMAYGVLYVEILYKFGQDKHIEAAWLGGLSPSLSLLLTPVVVALCRRKSTRLTAVLGGLVTALGCLFTSFASQFHQLFFSYGTVIGVGVGLVRDTSNLMVGQYFKRRRESVEVVVVSASGLGIALTSLLVKGAIRSVGWRLGLQAVTGVVFVTFFLAVCYRSATLYHPQRRAILHLKNQKRKIKDKAKIDDKPPFFDFGTLRSRTVQILLVATALAAFGVNTPLVFLVFHAEQEGLSENSLLLLQVFLGLAFALGCCSFGLLVVKNSVECRIARQYLCQAAAFMVAVAILAFTAVQGYHGYVLFTWIYGIFLGGYHYSLKMFTYEKVRARNFARAWGFVQWSQAIPTVFGVPITRYISSGYGHKSGFFFSSACVMASSLVFFLIDAHKHRVAKQRSVSSDYHRRCSSASCSRGRVHRSSSLPDLDMVSPLPGMPVRGGGGGSGAGFGLGSLDGTFGDLKRAELTCISEEGLADLGDNLLDDYELLADCMTSCDQVENYLMLSEYENNLIKTRELESFLDRSRRRKSLGRLHMASSAQTVDDSPVRKGHKDGEQRRPSVVNREVPTFRTNAWKLLQNPSRSITVIDEITTAL